ncbi:hypothetical protein Tco_0016087 [Tanacetum coccineum]
MGAKQGAGWFWYWREDWERVYTTLGVTEGVEDDIRLVFKVNSTTAYVDSETITLADGVQSSRMPVPLLDDPYVAVRQAQLVDTKSEPEEAPLEAEELQSLGFRVPLMGEEFEAFEPSKAMDLLDLAFRKRYRSSYETPSPSLTLPMRKRYRGTSELILDTDSEGDGLGDKDTDEDGEGSEEEVVPEGQQQAPPAADTAVDSEDGRVYTDIPSYVPLVAPDHTQRLDALPPTLFADISRYVKELYTRSGAVRDEIFSQRYMFRSLEREHERVAVTFGALWRPVLALEAWACQTDAQRTAMWHAMYDIQRENHDLRMQLAEERRNQLELADHVARMERRQESREE